MKKVKAHGTLNVNLFRNWSRESLPFYFCETTLKPDSEKKKKKGNFTPSLLNWK